ncbi:carboxymuconolactone decarboxylase family protein [Corticibacter populi]|uniref:Carboxymuconolactone decarboxylase family protein n=2 Tax=Corticibacter populi TaxID=1550736 RepID=A0A3M6QR56_9BURK|nr:carboxymuconolactone decarboxylase family protein [Corticibacter populi]RZS33694.1 AhpD family alkylhydroperoxidase [Corticibacter populi]
MTRISLKQRQDLPEHLHPLWDRMLGYGDFADSAGVMAHRLPVFAHSWRLLTDLADEALLPKRYLELALVAVSLLNECPYCVAHHTPKLSIQGISEQGATQILDYAAHPELDAVDRLVVEYAITVTRHWNRTRDEIFDRLKQHFSEAQIVELTWRIALCGAFNRFNDVLQVESAQPAPADAQHETPSPA